MATRIIVDGKDAGDIDIKLEREEIETTRPGDMVRSFIPGAELTATFSGRFTPAFQIPSNWLMLETGTVPRYWFLPRVTIRGLVDSTQATLFYPNDDGSYRMNVNLTEYKTIVTPHPRWYGRALAWMYYKLTRKNPPGGLGGL